MFEPPICYVLNRGVSAPCLYPGPTIQLADVSAFFRIVRFQPTSCFHSAANRALAHQATLSDMPVAFIE